MVDWKTGGRETADKAVSGLIFILQKGRILIWQNLSNVQNSHVHWEEH